MPGYLKSDSHLPTFTKTMLSRLKSNTKEVREIIIEKWGSERIECIDGDSDEQDHLIPAQDLINNATQ